MEGYSGSDIRLVCKEAAMRPVRKIFDVLESHQDSKTTHAHTCPVISVCNNTAASRWLSPTADLPAIQLETVTTADFLEAMAHTKPSARHLMDRYTAWEREYESVWHLFTHRRGKWLLTPQHTEIISCSYGGYNHLSQLCLSRITVKWWFLLTGLKRN